jgi:glycogen(starch) synthase
MTQIAAQAEYLFEASWEVCNKVGGINTVLKSKAAIMREYYDNYFLVGPYFEDKAALELRQEEPPQPIKQAIAELQQEGVVCHYGIWQIKGDPKTILIDSKALQAKKDEIKAKLWEENKIDSMNARWDFEEPMLWSWAVGKLLHAFERQAGGKSVVLHSHEWLSGFAQLFLKAEGSAIRTVFTTHATILGRTIAGSGYDLYTLLESINPEEWAYKLNVQEKFTAERAMAMSADVFTTVSEITALEARRILGRRPEVLVYNGLDLDKFPTIEETSIKHVMNRDIIREFLSYYFFPYYTFDLDHTLIYFILGRYEFHNKGIDVFIDALTKLNEQLKKENANRTIVVLFWIPMGNGGVKKEIIENKNYYRHITELVERHSNGILKKLVYDLLAQNKQDEQGFFTEEFVQNIRRDVSHFRRVGNPPVLTHHIDAETNDAIVSDLLTRGLDNKKDDQVKVIVYPAYLDGSDSLLNLPYYDAMMGCHLGVFPSSYEPWGYTPLEAAACGVASVTTDLAGFGRFVLRKNVKDKGISVMKREKHSYPEIVDELYTLLNHYAHLDHAERVNEKIMAKNVSALADWKHFVKHYIEAHNQALGVQR